MASSDVIKQISPVKLAEWGYTHEIDTGFSETNPPSQQKVYFCLGFEPKVNAFPKHSLQRKELAGRLAVGSARMNYPRA